MYTKAITYSNEISEKDHKHTTNKTTRLLRLYIDTIQDKQKDAGSTVVILDMNMAIVPVEITHSQFE